MKVIEAMKQIKDLQRKVDDLTGKVKANAAISSMQTPTYADQKRQVSEWLQSISDLLKEILRLRIAIQRTNLATQVEIELGGKTVKKTVAEWIHRRRDLATQECEAWMVLSDRGIQEGTARTPAGDAIEVKILRFYDPAERDNKIELFRSEPMKIDSTLEVVNAITDLIE